MKIIKLDYVSSKIDDINIFLLTKHYSPSNIYHLIENGNVLLNNNIVKGKNEKININDKIEVTLLDEINTLPRQEKDINIVYEDDYILIVNKDYDLEIEPSRFNYDNNLASRVTNYYFNNNIHSKIHLINRLDKLTSGLVIIAKNQYIKNLFKYVNITKKYQALVQGKIDEEGTINIKIDRSETVKREVSESGKNSTTLYKLIKYDSTKDASLVDVTILTGRTHQIRLSFSHINHPLINDPIYSNKKDGDMYLKAYYLKFLHPITNKELEIII